MLDRMHMLEAELPIPRPHGKLSLRLVEGRNLHAKVLLTETEMVAGSGNPTNWTRSSIEHLQHIHRDDDWGACALEEMRTSFEEFWQSAEPNDTVCAATLADETLFELWTKDREDGLARESFRLDAALLVDAYHQKWREMVGGDVAPPPLTARQYASAFERAGVSGPVPTAVDGAEHFEGIRQAVFSENASC